MIKVRLMNSKEVKKLKGFMKEQYGTVINGVFYINNKRKVFLGSEFTKLLDLRSVNAEGVGLYIGRLNDDSFRPSIEGIQLLQPVKNVIDLTNEQLWEWLRGFNLKIDLPDGFYALRFKQEFVGPAKIVNGTLWNYVPKERRIKSLRKD